MRNSLLVGWMNILRRSHIERDRHAGMPQRKRASLCIANRRPTSSGRMEAGYLHKQKRKITFAPLLPPIRDQRRKHSRIVGCTPGIAVRFPLVPEHSFDGEAGIGGNHGVEESSGYP